jgi:hypothetical protein
LPCGSWHMQRLELYYIINYYFKYLELLDTVFLVLKKKPLGSCPFILRIDLETNQLIISARVLVGVQLSCMYTTTLSLLSCALPNLTVALASYVYVSFRF